MSIERRQWIERCARALVHHRSWLAVSQAIDMADGLWAESQGAVSPEVAADEELASWPAAYVVLLHGQPPEFRDTASAALNCAMQLLANEDQPLSADVLDPCGKQLWALRREDDGSITDLPF